MSDNNVLNPRVMFPYSVQWRPDLVTGWVLIKSFNSHDEAREGAKEALAKWSGQVRVTTQHVIEVIGLWTGENEN